jgi:hypothetical protein
MTPFLFDRISHSSIPPFAMSSCADAAPPLSAALLEQVTADPGAASGSHREMPQGTGVTCGHFSRSASVKKFENNHPSSLVKWLALESEVSMKQNGPCGTSRGPKKPASGTNRQWLCPPTRFSSSSNGLGLKTSPRIPKGSGVM